MTKEELALEVIDRLKKEYPDAGCTLDYDQAWRNSKDWSINLCIG